MAGDLTKKDEDLLAQFIAGTSHEMEHTDKWYEAARTALDHLRENRRYYSVMKRAFPEEGARDAEAVQLVGRGLRLKNPYRTEHAARQRDPREFKTFGRISEHTHDGKRVDFIIGGYGDDDGRGSRVQSVRFPTDEWTEDEAREWLVAHKMRSHIEPAVR